MKKFLLLTAIASVASVAAVAPVMAEVTDAGIISVSASVPKLCTTPSNAPVALGDYNGTVAVGPTSANTTFKCTNGTTAEVAFTSTSTGSTSGGNLVNGTNTIAYTFTTSGTTGTGNGVNSSASALTSTVAVSIAADQAPVASESPYEDTIEVVVTY